MPAGFAAYVRIFHPLRLLLGRRTRWSELAEAQGLAVGARTRLGEVLPSGYRTEGAAKAAREVQVTARFTREEWRALRPILTSATTSDSIIIGIWEGSEPTGAQFEDRLQLPLRGYHLVEVPLQRWDACEVVWNFWLNLAWPADRSWFLHNDIIATSTYLGCSRATADAVLDLAALEAVEVAIDDPV